MKLYLEITKMNFVEDDIEHNIIRGILNEEFLGYDEIIELPDNDKFIEDTLRGTKEGIVFDIREKDTWWGYPLYELKNGRIISFDYTRYKYFTDTNRRNMLARRINQLYNPSSEIKILRRTLKYIMDVLNMEYPDNFRKYNNKVEAIINRNPKN